MQRLRWRSAPSSAKRVLSAEWPTGTQSGSQPRGYSFGLPMMPSPMFFGRCFPMLGDGFSPMGSVLCGMGRRIGRQRNRLVDAIDALAGDWSLRPTNDPKPR